MSLKPYEAIKLKEEKKPWESAGVSESSLNELLPCPFCWNNYPHTAKKLDENLNDIYQVYCDECGCSMPFEPSIELAHSRWNERAR